MLHHQHLKLAGSLPYNLIISIVAIASPAPFTIHQSSQVLYKLDHVCLPLFLMNLPHLNLSFKISGLQRLHYHQNSFSHPNIKFYYLLL